MRARLAKNLMRDELQADVSEISFRSNPDLTCARAGF